MDRHRWLLFLCVPCLVLIAGCGRPTQAQLAATATRLGCWPYGASLPRPTRTPLLSTTPAHGTPTATAGTPTTTPAPTWAWCTPEPATPTLTPTTTPTPTPWTRPTPRPVLDRSARLLNLSNMPGTDHEPALAMHPTKGWAAVLWVNNAPGRGAANTGIFVRVQDPRTGDWRRGISINTRGSYGFAANPDIAIDDSGRIHVVFGQAEVLGSSDTLYPHYTISDDQGETWSQPEPLPLPANAGRLAFDMELGIDPTGRLHIVYAVSPCFDCFYHVHLLRPADAPAGTPWQMSVPPEPQTASHLRARLAFLPLADGRIRTVLGVACFRGCEGPRRVRVFWRNEPDGAWQLAEIPGADATHPEPAPFALDSLMFTDHDDRAWACFAWGDYWRSAVFSSCSSDGVTWQAPQTIVYTEEPELPAEASETPVPGTLPQAVPNQQFDSIDRGYAPALLYERSTNKLMAVWILRQRQSPNPAYLAYSYRQLDAPVWTPLLDGPQAAHQPKLRLFSQTTRRSQAAGQPALAYAGSGLAAVSWMELEGDENIEVYLGMFNPAAMLAEVDR